MEDGDQFIFDMIARRRKIAASGDVPEPPIALIKNIKNRLEDRREKYAREVPEDVPQAVPPVLLDDAGEF